MKVLMMIISGGDDPIYRKLIPILQTNQHPQVRNVFIEYSQGVSEITLTGDTLLLPGIESYDGLTCKTIDSIEYFLRDESITHVIRTNLSSVWHFPRLLSHLETLRPSGLYGGVIGKYVTGDYVSGAGMYMTRDVALLLVKIKQRACEYPYIDDVAIACALSAANVDITSIPTRVDLTSPALFHEKKNIVTGDLYHYRLKQSEDRSVEPNFMQELISILDSCVHSTSTI
jgi:hypothetical protein